MKQQLRPHQKKALAAVRRNLKDGGRATVVKACGTGKTLVGVRAADSLAPSGLVVVLAPTLALLDQTALAWQAQGRRRDAMAVCSAAELRARHDHITFVSTDADATADWLARQQGPKVVFGTYVSSDVLGKALQVAGMRADLVVCDEAHRTASSIESVNSTVLHDDAFPAERRLFMTATPKFWAEDAEAWSMDNVTLYGETVYELNFAQAVAMKPEPLLVDFEVVIVVHEEGKVDARSCDAALASLAKATKEFGNLRALTFHSFVKDAKEMARRSAELPSLDVVALSGADTAEMRSEVLSWLAEPTQRTRAVASAKVLAEGVDVPSVDAVLFADPRQSPIDIVQIVGRAMRLSEGKDRALVILPFVAHDKGSFKAVRNVMQVMRSLDPSWDPLRAVKRVVGDGEDGEDGEGVDVGGEGRVRIIGDLNEMTEKLVVSVAGRVTRTTAKSWDCRLKEVETFVRSHSRLPGIPDGILGQWVISQRARKTTLSAQQRSLLEEVPGWTWDKDERWRLKLRELERHVRLNGELPKQKSGPLGNWVRGQRDAYRNGDLSTERIHLLELVPGWSWSPLVDKFDATMRHLVEYVQEFGNPWVPKKHVCKDGFRLGFALCNLRQRYKRGEVPDVQIAKAAACGMQWRLRSSKDADHICKLLRRLADFSAASGHVNVPRWQLDDHGALGAQLHELRRRRRRGTLDDETIAMFDAIGFDWSPGSKKDKGDR